jgi:hypothetical protein
MNENLKTESDGTEFLINGIIFGVVDSFSYLASGAILKKLNNFKLLLQLLLVSFILYSSKLANFFYFNDN